MSLSPPTYENLDLESRINLEEVIQRFETAFVVDPATRLENFLSTARGQNERAALLLELLCAELEHRRRAGQVPTAEEYLLRLPDDAETIQTAFRAPLENLTGTRLGKYRLTRLIGRGGMGVVYAATDTVVKRQVAVKILSDSLARDARAQAYLLREAQLVGQLLHPNIVTLFEASEVDGVAFLVLEYVPGGSAAAYLRQNGPFNWMIASRILLDVCQGLATAHGVGLIHRDIKPANILLLEPENTSSTSGLNKSPLAKLTDFGLAGASEDNQLVGTPKYMAPEQFTDGTSNVTTDIYSLGATYFALLTGLPPFEARTLVELQEAHRTAPIPKVRKINPAVPRECARIVRRCLAKSPEQRYPTAERLMADLNYLLTLTEKPRLSRRRYLILALAGVAALGLAAGGVAVWTGALAPAAPVAPVSPELGAWEPLFNGRDLTGWQIRDSHGAVRPDTDAVFAVKEIDGEPAVWASGKAPLYLSTLQEYENYHLSLEYRWLPPVPASLNSGVLYHCSDFSKKDFQGHEFDLQPPNSGRYFPNQARTRMNLGVLHQGQVVPGVEAKADAALNHNFEHKPGEWNRVDLICMGDSVLHVLNSRVVLTLARSRIVVGKKEKTLTRGRIMLQSSRGAIAFRHIILRSISGIPRNYYLRPADRARHFLGSRPILLNSLAASALRRPGRWSR